MTQLRVASVATEDEVMHSAATVFAVVLSLHSLHVAVAIVVAVVVLLTQLLGDCWSRGSTSHTRAIRDISRPRQKTFLVPLTTWAIFPLDTADIAELVLAQTANINQSVQGGSKAWVD